jgi:hypothetical protein
MHVGSNERSAHSPLMDAVTSHSRSVKSELQSSCSCRCGVRRQDHAWHFGTPPTLGPLLSFFVPTHYHPQPVDRLWGAGDPLLRGTFFSWGRPAQPCSREVGGALVGGLMAPMVNSALCAYAVPLGLQRTIPIGKYCGNVMENPNITLRPYGHEPRLIIPAYRSVV